MDNRVSLSFEAATTKLFSMDNILLLTHANPDGDCIGSAVALYMILKKIGKRVKIACPSVIPKRLEFLLEGISYEDVLCEAEQIAESGFCFSCAVSVDVASDGLLGDVFSLVEGKIELAFDHHETNSLSAKNIYVLPSASAAGEIIYSVAMAAERKYMMKFVGPLVVTAIYAAIASDTGCFRFSNTTSKTHMIAASLIESGADSGDINYRLFEIKSKKQFAVEKIVMENAGFFCDGKIAVSYITQKQLDSVQADSSDTDTCVQMLRTVEGTEIAIFIKEKEEKTYRVSVRTNRYVDASLLCGAFGGGGHKRAAGCTVSGSFSTVVEKLRKEAEKQL